MTKRVLFVLTNHADLGDTGKKTGWHCSEVSHPYRILTEAGCEVSFASPDGGPVPMDPASEDKSDPVNASFMENPMIQAALMNTLSAEEIQAGIFQAIFFAGGLGTMWDFPGSQHLAAAAAHIYNTGGIVAAICHGPAALLDVRLADGTLLIKGKELTSFSDQEEKGLGLENTVPFLLETELTKRGARFVSAAPGQKKVVVSERLVTGQNPASADGLGGEIKKLLEKRWQKKAEPA